MENPMRFVEMSTFGDADVLRLADGDKPKPAHGDVLIKVAVAGVNRPDVLQRKGLYPPPPGASPILGLEVSGMIEELGPGVDQWQLGDRVCALTNGGGYAEYVVAPAAQCLPRPQALSMVEAAALPETFFTVWSNLFDRAKLSMGESLLVHGGTSGIGTTAIQMAVAFGARVFATAGSDEKCDACVALGAEIAVNYRNQDFVQVLKTATDSRGIDVILDMVGGDYIARNIELAATDGRIVSIAFLNGSKAEIDFMDVMLKRLTVTGSTLRPRSPEEKAGIAARLLEVVWPLIERREIRPQIARTFPLEGAAAAHKLMESSSHIGKIMLIVDDPE
jgi:NADPH2:quinone reductase